MCNFKSGIILKNKVVLAPEGNESHSDLLENLEIEDTHMNASKTFVRAELIPKNNDKMTNVKDWRYKVDQEEYDEEAGYPDGGIAPGTKWEDVPEDFVCPLCMVGKDQFSEA